MLDGFWIRNYRTLKQVGIGACFPQFSYIDDWAAVLPYELGAATLFAGANGTGKSTVADAFSFVSDCFYHGVDFACQKRGGYSAVYTHGSTGAMSFGFLYQYEDESDPVTYAVSIACTAEKIPYIESELLAYRRGKESVPVFFLQNGIKTIRYLAPDERITNAELTKIEFTDFKHLGLQALESHPKYPVLAAVRKLFNDWVPCDFTPDPARGLDVSLPRKHESQRGTNLSGLVKYLVNRYGSSLNGLLERITNSLPDVNEIILDVSQSERPRLSFKMYGQETLIPITLMSAADIRLFTYCLLLEEDEPAPLVFLEEPANGLDRLHKYAMFQQIGRVMDFPKNRQMFATVHQLDVIDAVHPSNVWLFEKDENGHTSVERASDSMPSSEHGGEALSPHWFSDRYNPHG
ncbi:MAG: AAA family ATPase [Planctomycetaceae bacterium]|jgi:predicted ATPase|nr:AAA family ATPase [Planctomycetaceae bacterium]